MGIKAITEENGLEVGKNIIILGVKYSIWKVGPKVYIFDESYFTPAKGLLKIPTGEQVCEIIELNKITKDGNFPVFKFKYYSIDGYIGEMDVYTENGKDFNQLGDKQIIEKPKPQQIIEEKQNKTKSRVARFIDKIKK